MKITLLLAALWCSITAFAQTTETTFSGNGKNNFGGAVGEGSLTISENPDSVSFSITKGPGLFDSLIVFYLDIQAGGISSTSVLTGSNIDKYLAAVSGKSPAHGNAILDFPEDFQPDGAVVFNKDSGRIFYFVTIPIVGTQIVENQSFKVLPAQDTYKASASKADLGLSGPLNFKFLGTYIGQSASRSNEAFGDLFDDYLRPAGTVSYNPYIVKTYYTYITGVLPVTLIDFKVAKEGNAANLYWQVAGESNIEKYEVQRSADGNSFSTIATYKATNSGAAVSYSFKDQSAADGINYYRLIITERGRSEISKVVSLNMKVSKDNFITTYLPGNTLNITLNGITAGAYKLRIFNFNGQLIKTETVKVNAPNQTMQIQLPGNLNKGIYRTVLQSQSQRYVSGIFVR